MAIVQIQKRFSFDDDIYEVVSFIEPENNKSLNPPTLGPYLRCYSLPGWSRSAIDKEWREHADSGNDDETVTLTAVAYWKSV